MSFALPPLALVAGATHTVVQLSSPYDTKALVMANKSVFDLIVFGASDITDVGIWLPAGTQDLFNPNKGIRGQVDVQVVDNRPAGSIAPTSATLCGASSGPRAWRNINRV